MADLNMYGPYPLTKEEVNKRITKKSPGNYAYGTVQDDSFYVEYVGRADSDLNDRIKHGIGIYDYFKFSYAKSAKEAFEKECRNYHDFGGKDVLDNKYHPDRPDGTDYDCPVDGCNELDD